MKLIRRTSLSARFLKRNSDQYHFNHPLQGVGDLGVARTSTINNGTLYDHRAYCRPKGKPFSEATVTYDYTDTLGGVTCRFNGKEVYMSSGTELHIFESRAAAEQFLTKKG